MRKVEVGRSVEILLKFEIFLFLNPLNTQNKHVSKKVVRGADICTKSGANLSNLSAKSKDTH